MSEWHEFLSPDGAPPLWPRPPRWQHDPDLMRELLVSNGLHGLLRTAQMSGPGQLPEPTDRCERCGKAGTQSMCMCGERYCSRECLLADWSGHQSICRVVYDNNMVQWVITKLEMKDTLCMAEFAAAHGQRALPPMKGGRGTAKQQRAEQRVVCAHCNAPGATFQCSACKLNTANYCSKDCQTQAWKGHKKACKAERKRLAAKAAPASATSLHLSSVPLSQEKSAVLEIGADGAYEVLG